MGASASAAAAFYRDVATKGKVWAIRDEGGFPAPPTSSGQRSMPFWSSEGRARRVTKPGAAYAGFELVPIDLAEFQQNWLPGLARDAMLVGVNWSGPRVTGYDVAPGDVANAITYHLKEKRSWSSKLLRWFS